MLPMLFETTDNRLQTCGCHSTKETTCLQYVISGLQEVGPFKQGQLNLLKSVGAQ